MITKLIVFVTSTSNSRNVTITSHSRIWGSLLGSIQGMSDKCFGPCTI